MFKSLSDRRKAKDARYKEYLWIKNKPVSIWSSGDREIYNEFRNNWDVVNIILWSISISLCLFYFGALIYDVVYVNALMLIAEAILFPIAMIRGFILFIQFLIGIL